MLTEHLDELTEVEYEHMMNSYAKLQNLEPGTKEYSTLSNEILEHHKIMNQYIKLNNDSTIVYDQMEFDEKIKNIEINIEKKKMENETVEKDKEFKKEIAKLIFDAAKIAGFVGIQIFMFRVGMGVEIEHPITFKTYKESKNEINKLITREL